VAPRVTAVVAAPRGRVHVELDGERWRTLPAGAVVRARLVKGVELDRARARSLNRALRHERALTAAARTLRHQERSAADVAARLARSGIRPQDREAAVEALQTAGYLDDMRYASTRAALLASRGYGDEAVRSDLERQGVGPEELEAALGRLEPEPERARAAVQRLGATPKTAATLARRGFARESIESVLSEVLAGLDD
jgi:SOS response regulatory protein OraA/RecX